MAHLEQYEVWALNGDKWEFVAAFRDFDVASALAKNRTSRVRLIRAAYEDGKRVQEEILAEVGAIRQAP